MTKGNKGASKIRRSESTKQILREKLEGGGSQGKGSHQMKDIFQTILRGIEKKVT